MAVKPCAKEPFVGTQQFEVPNGTTIARLSLDDILDRWTLKVCRRSGVPVYGVTKNPKTIVKVGNDSLTICGNANTTVYTLGFVAGNIVYTDAAMTIPLVGSDFIVDGNTGFIWEINNATGVLVGTVPDQIPCDVISQPILYDFAPSTKDNADTLTALAMSAYQSSYDFMNNIAGTTDYEGDYVDYLYRKVSAEPCLMDRYMEIYNKMATFFRLHAAIPAYDLAIYKELTDQIAKVMRESDKQLFIPPGVYTFKNGSAAKTALDAWIATDPNLNGFFMVEVITT